MNFCFFKDPKFNKTKIEIYVFNKNKNIMTLLKKI